MTYNASGTHPKKDRSRFPFLSFISSFSSLSLPTSLLPCPVLLFSLAFCLTLFVVSSIQRLKPPVSYAFSPHLTSFPVFGSSLARISLTSSFVQAPARVLRLGRLPLSSLYLSPPQFSVHSYSRVRRRRSPVFRVANMSASGDDTPLVKSNGKPGMLPPIPAIRRSLHV